MIKLRSVGYLLIIALLFSSCKVGRFVYYNFADIKDYKKFPSREAKAPQIPFKFAALTHQIEPSLRINDQAYNFNQYLQESETVAFLIIQNDTIKYEQYFNGYEEDNIVTSFSMAKSITSILIGIAIDEGKINSVQDPITKYIPELSANEFDAVTIEHILQMTSGLDFKEQYTNPFGHVATFYYGRQLRKAISKLKLEDEPGKKFAYRSGNSQLLGLVLERALGNQTITSYLQEKLWQPLGMEYNATWSLDKKNNGLEKTFCCINARARDFAKIGRLYLHNGYWNGKQIVSKEWVQKSTQIDTLNGSAWHYQYQWWLPTKDGDFLAKGILGQYIYVNPNKNLIMVRLGKNKGKVDWEKVLPIIATNF